VSETKVVRNLHSMLETVGSMLRIDRRRMRDHPPYERLPSRGAHRYADFTPARLGATAHLQSDLGQPVRDGQAGTGADGASLCHVLSNDPGHCLTDSDCPTRAA